MASENHALPNSLLDLLSNDLILRHISPYIGIRSLDSLAATSKAYKSIVYDTPHVFQHVDLCGTHSLSWIREGGSMEDEFAIFHRYDTLFSTLESRDVMQDVRTLVLDDLVVPIRIIEDVLFNERFQIRLLSWRLSEDGYRTRTHEGLRWLFRSHFAKLSCSKETLKPRGFYLFGLPSGFQEMLNMRDTMTRPEATGVTASMGAQLGAGVQTTNKLDDHRRDDPYSDSPYGTMGPSEHLNDTRWVSDWPKILEACAGSISFDVVVCRHNREDPSDPGPRFGTIRLAGCISCGTCPEGPAYPGLSPAAHLPLLSPPPLHSSKVEMAQCMNVTNGQPYPPLILRCRYCLRDRWCENCNTWWCESCYTIPKGTSRTNGDAALGAASKGEIKVHNGLCVSKCLMDDLLNGAGEGGMWG